MNKFSSKRDELTGYKYKKFNIDEFKGLLSAPTEAERESTKSKKKKDPASADKKKFDRENRCLKSTRLSQSLKRMF